MKSAIEGVFTEKEDDRHVRLRNGMLNADHTLPLIPREHIQPFSDIDALDTRSFVETLDASGLAVLQFPEPLTSGQFLALGALLGSAIPESASDPALAPYIEESVILNLISDYGNTADVSLQPFATNYITIHTESSRRTADEQPRYIMLMCCEPGDASASAQTVLIPMEQVLSGLTPSEIEILSHTRYQSSENSPNLLRRHGDRLVFSFRDFHEQPMHWVYSGDTSDEAAVNAAIRRLLACIYESRHAAGIPWQRGMLAVLDNLQYFHGKTAARPHRPKLRRHLKRLRIRNGA